MSTLPDNINYKILQEIIDEGLTHQWDDLEHFISFIEAELHNINPYHSQIDWEVVLDTLVITADQYSISIPIDDIWIANDFDDFQMHDLMSLDLDSIPY